MTSKSENEDDDDNDDDEEQLLSGCLLFRLNSN